MKKQTIRLDGGEHAVVIETDGKGGGSMTVIGTAGALREACPDCGSEDCQRTCPAQAEFQDSQRELAKEQRLLFNAAMHGVESFLLALACAGVEIQAPPFAQALQTTLEQLDNKYD